MLILNKHNESDSKYVNKKNLPNMVTMIYNISSTNSLGVKNIIAHVIDSPTKEVTYEPQNERVLLNSVDIPRKRTSNKDYTITFRMENVETKLRNPHPLGPINSTNFTKDTPVIMNGDPISQRNSDNNTYLQGMNMRIPKYLFSSTHEGTILIEILDQTTDELSTNVEKIVYTNVKRRKNTINSNQLTTNWI